jgi:hypothetical protein
MEPSAFTQKKSLTKLRRHLIIIGGLCNFGFMTRIQPQISNDATASLRVAEFFTYLISECGYLEPRLIGPDRYACLLPLMFTHAIITGAVGQRSTYDDRWCYDSRDSARAALDAWSGQGEPDGWHRHPFTGRRRRYAQGSVDAEWVNP